MFDNLQDKMDRVFKTLRGEGTLNEWHVENALKEIRVALLEADVNFKVVKEFTNRVREKALGREVLTAFSPAQQVTKIVRDELQGLLGGAEVGLRLGDRRPRRVESCLGGGQFLARDCAVRSQRLAAAILGGDPNQF